MSCPSELTLSIHADGELGAAEAARLASHLAGCPGCAGRLAALRRETDLLRAALELPALVGERRAGAGLLRLLPAAACALLVVAGLAAGRAAAGAALAGLPGWLNPFELPGALNLLFNSLFLVVTPGGGIMSPSPTLISSAAAALAAGLALAVALRLRPRAAMVALAPLLVAVLAAPAGAVELRSGDNLVVGADEVIEGSVVLAGETVLVEGKVQGDLIAFARNLTVRGPVGGGIYGFAQNVDVEGSAGGAIHLFGQFVRAAGTTSGNGYLFGQGVRLLPGSSVYGDAILFGETLQMEGSVGSGLVACGARAELRGEVGGDVQGWTEELIVADGAVGGGDLTAHLPAGTEPEVAAGASIGGSVTTEAVEESAPRSRYTRPGFYLWKLVGLVGAFLVGAVLWWLAPGLLGSRLDGGGALARIGIGLVILVAAPIALILVGLTLIGLPLALIGLVLYLVALYLSKIVTADLLGRAILGWPEETPRRALPALALGLVILAVVGLIPFLGGLVAFVALLLGLGLLAWRLWERKPAAPPVAG